MRLRPWKAVLAACLLGMGALVPVLSSLAAVAGAPRQSALPPVNAATALEPAAARTAAAERSYAGLTGVFAASNTTAEPVPAVDLAPHAAAAVLMDASSGQVLWAKNPNARRPAASVTKLMTMAVILNAIRSGRVRWNDLVSASEAAVRTPGAQIWLELGETMSVRALFYAVAVHSANDAAVALAEYVGGTLPHFVEMMNAEARRLGLRDTLYTDPSGLDDQNAYTSAYDVALLSRYLVIDHPNVLAYTKTWEYRLRANKLWMVNRNRLLTRVPGVDGLKTGYTERAGYSLAATAIRGSTRLIAVVLGDPSSQARFDEATALLQWGFSHYATVAVAARGEVLARLPVDGGARRTAAVVPAHPFGVTVPRGQEKSVATRVQLPGLLIAPLRAGQEVGFIAAATGGREVARVPLVVRNAVPRLGPVWLWVRMWRGSWPWR